MAISPHGFEESGFPMICASGSWERFAFLILTPTVRNSGIFGESKSPVRDSEDFVKRRKRKTRLTYFCATGWWNFGDGIYNFQAAAMSSKACLVSVYKSLKYIKLPLSKKVKKKKKST